MNPDTDLHDVMFSIEKKITLGEQDPLKQLPGIYDCQLHALFILFIPHLYAIILGHKSTARIGRAVF